MNDVSMSAMPRVSPMQFAGRPGFIRLLLKNALLSVVTLGFYRFWARTAVRRVLWNNVVIAGEPLEYAGRGIELFIGFLIALAIIAPMAAIYGLIQYLMFVSPQIAIGAQIAYFAVLGVLIQVAIFRARRYRLSRTQWRGIRCWQDGSTGRYVGMSLLYGLLSVVTLGLAVPWMNTALQRYKIEHTIFGNRRFSFTGTGRGLIGKWLVVYALGALPLLVFAAMNFSVWLEMLELFSTPDVDEDDFRMLGEQIGGFWLLPLMYVGGGIAWIWYSIAQFRYFVANTQFGDITLHSAAKMSRVLLILLAYLGCLFLAVLLILLVLAAAGAALWFILGLNWDGNKAPLAILPFVLIVLTYFVNLIVSQYFMTYRFARHFIATMTITNLASIESVVQSKEARPRYGEGLADAFDLGAV